MSPISRLIPVPFESAIPDKIHYSWRKLFISEHPVRTSWISIWKSSEIPVPIILCKNHTNSETFSICKYILKPVWVHLLLHSNYNLEWIQCSVIVGYVGRMLGFRYSGISRQVRFFSLGVRDFLYIVHPLWLGPSCIPIQLRITSSPHCPRIMFICYILFMNFFFKYHFYEKTHVRKCVLIRIDFDM